MPRPRKRTSRQTLLDLPDLEPGLDWGERWARRNGFLRLVGVDEVGRGPVAGPVVAAAVCLPDALEKELTRDGLDDSKRIAAELREVLSSRIRERAVIGVGVVGQERIDETNILRATHEAMAAAVRVVADRLGDTPPECILVDGRDPIQPAPLPGVPQRTLVAGDGRSVAVAAASVVAKVHRDAIMVDLDRRYPGYGFAGHKGYLCREHAEALERLGPSPVHRRTFGGVRELLPAPAPGPGLFD